jgi:hypothetical protein
MYDFKVDSNGVRSIPNFILIRSTVFSHHLIDQHVKSDIFATYCRIM